MNLQLTDIGQAIGLAIAPVFLLAGVGALLIVLTNRLGRIIDRSRLLEERAMAGTADCLAELFSLHRRAALINGAITASTSCGLLVCMVVAMLFLGDTTSLPLDQFIALSFVCAMLALTACFVFLLREVFICCHFMRARQMKMLAAGRLQET